MKAEDFGGLETARLRLPTVPCEYRFNACFPQTRFAIYRAISTGILCIQEKGGDRLARPRSSTASFSQSDMSIHWSTSLLTGRYSADALVCLRLNSVLDTHLPNLNAKSRLVESGLLLPAFTIPAHWRKFGLRCRLYKMTTWHFAQKVCQKRMKLTSIFQCARRILDYESKLTVREMILYLCK
jgi:hypothetical protein